RSRSLVAQPIYQLQRDQPTFSSRRKKWHSVARLQFVLPGKGLTRQVRKNLPHWHTLLPRNFSCRQEHIVFDV
ncbi:MAG: hypothetical protein ACRDFS_06125, partial [Chloroflexota bacterium]